MRNDTPQIPPDLKDRLRKESPDVRADLQDVWTLIDSAETAASKGADPEAAWTALVRRHPELDASPTDGTDASSRTDSAPVSRRRKRTARRPNRRQWQAPTAVGVALAAIVLVWSLWLWRQPVTVTTPPGQQQSVILPDGSTADLNSGTTLAYRRGFQAWPLVDADRRTVRLDGEAFFEVTDGPRSFVIETANAHVTVVGTRFNVRSRTEEDASTTETEVTVVDGRVRVAAQKQPSRTIVLSESGHVSRVTDPASAPTSPQSASVKHVLAWRDNGFAARAQPLTAVIHDLERRYDATLRIHESVERTRAPVSLYYPGPTELETILHDLCTARDLNYRPTSRGFEIFSASDTR